MASTPSASALSAVLRCRRNIWKRNSPSAKRPATAAYSLGMAGGTARSSPAGRSRSRQASAWGDLLQGERVSLGRRVTLALKSRQAGVEILVDRDSCELGKFCHPKVAQSSGRAHSAVHNALVRQLARGFLSFLPGTQTFSKVFGTVHYKSRGSDVCETASVQDPGTIPGATLKVCIMSPRLVENPGEVPRLASSSWSTLKNTCLSLTALVSGFWCLRLAVLFRSSSSDAAQHLQSHLSGRQTDDDELQASGQPDTSTELTSSEDNCGSTGRERTEDGPD